jgi:hypothetical protein
MVARFLEVVLDGLAHGSLPGAKTPRGAHHPTTTDVAP